MAHIHDICDCVYLVSAFNDTKEKTTTKKKTHINYLRDRALSVCVYVAVTPETKTGQKQTYIYHVTMLQ